MSKCCFLKVVNLDINESVANLRSKTFSVAPNMLDSDILSNILKKKIQSTLKNHLGLELNVPVYCMTTQALL
jgi:hypothetical protein